MKTDNLTVDELINAAKRFKKKEREEFFERIAKMRAFREDLIDIATILAREHEKSRSYEEFIAELKKEGKI